jgi:hypothetical protein
VGEISKDILTLLTHLLPGFVTAWVIYGLTSYPRPGQFERVIQALIYSFLVGVLVAVEEKALAFAGRYLTVGIWDTSSELIASAVSAIALGLAFAYFSNNDKFYAFARRNGMTRRTAYPSEWYGAFTAIQRYIVLHLNDGRRISGYPIEWPSDPSSGHFRLVDAAWVKEDRTEVRLDGDHSILLQAKQVELVEFLKHIQELPDATEAAKSVSTANPAGTGAA